MKKSLLFACALGLVISAGAQNRTTKNVLNLRDAQRQINSPNPSATGSPSTSTNNVQRTTPLVVTNTAVSDVTLGCSGNLYGAFTRPGRPTLDYAMVGTSGVLTLVHRSGPGCTPSDGTASTGYYMFDLSKDGGTTWNVAPSLGPIMDGGANPARYPQAVIHNVTGNTIADSAFIESHGPGLLGSTWDGYHHGAAPVGNPTNFSWDYDIFDSTVSWQGLIPNSMEINNGTIWVSDMGFDDVDYTDTIVLRKGTWSAALRRFAYTTTLLPFPVVQDTAAGKPFGTTNVSFSSNGMTGYLAVTACASLTFSSDTSMYVIIWKTTDGGATWGTPMNVSMDVNSQMGTTAVKYGATGLHLDGAVDNAGKLHLITTIHPVLGGGSISIAPGAWGIFSIMSDGTTTTKTLLDKPLTFTHTVGAISDYSRGQIAVSANRDKIIYVWFDTDTVAFPGGANSNPNAIARMYDVATSSLDGKTQLTAGSAADGLMTYGFVAYLAGSGGGCAAGSYNVHLGYQAPTGVDTAPGIFHYVGGACITGVNDATNVVFNFGEIFPNPTSGLTTIEITMKKSDKITVEVTNLLGQAIYTSNENLTAGDHTLTVDASKWNSGVYFYTVKSVDFSITKKMVRE